MRNMYSSSCLKRAQPHAIAIDRPAIKSIKITSTGQLSNQLRFTHYHINSHALKSVRCELWSVEDGLQI